MLNHVFNQDAKIIITSTDKHGDQVVSSETDILCRFRYFTEIDQSGNREGLTTTADAIIWLAPELDVAEGTILYTDGKYWRVNRLVKARRMSGDTVEFLKAFVSKHEV